ncbi:hypothetical protein [Candidatus Avelusimicrobium sp.]|uniref:hypothetical protein n=1 Tax=Candidatus Avelusimicrobium sp. TaxID=3048833 RepID=UPI003D7D0477
MLFKGHPEFSSGSTDWVVVCCRWTLTTTTQDVDTENPAGRQFRMTPSFYNGLFVVIPEGFYPGSRRFVRGDNNGKNRFPTTTFGNDDLSSLSSPRVSVGDLSLLFRRSL